MPPWRSSIEIDAPCDYVWDLVADFEHWPQWGLSVREVDPPRGRVGPGRRGRVHSVIGVWLSFEITDVREGSCWAWKVAGVDATTHNVEPIRAGCRVTFSAPPWAPFYLPVLAVSLRRLRRLALR